MDYVSRIKTLTGVYEQDELLTEIVNIIEEKILSYMQVETIPNNLSWIVIEMAIARFNRIGSEGLTTESVDGKQSSYVEDELAQYKHYLNEYMRENTKNKGWKLF